MTVLPFVYNKWSNGVSHHNMNLYNCKKCRVINIYLLKGISQNLVSGYLEAGHKPNKMSNQLKFS